MAREKETSVTFTLKVTFLHGSRKICHSLLHACTTCRKLSAKPSSQLMGQLPIEQLTPGPVFDKVAVDFAGPVLTKYAHVRKPVIVMFVCLCLLLSKLCI